MIHKKWLIFSSVSLGFMMFVPSIVQADEITSQAGVNFVVSDDNQGETTQDCPLGQNDVNLPGKGYPSAENSEVWLPKEQRDTGKTPTIILSSTSMLQSGPVDLLEGKSLLPQTGEQPEEIVLGYIVISMATGIIYIRRR